MEADTEHHGMRVLIVGAGIMGTGIARVMLEAGYRVCLTDVNDQALASARGRIEDDRYGLQRAVELGILTPLDCEAALSRLSTNSSLSAACGDADFVIEAIPEDLREKIRLFRAVDAMAPASAVIASNTAGLPITALAHATNRPDRVIGWHWAQPTPVMRIAEIVVHSDIAAATTDLVLAMAARCGRVAVVVNDAPTTWGFVANRINAAVRREAERVVADGVATRDQVDVILKAAFHWPMGPFEMQDAAATSFRDRI